MFCASLSDVLDVNVLGFSEDSFRQVEIQSTSSMLWPCQRETTGRRQNHSWPGLDSLCFSRGDRPPLVS